MSDAGSAATPDLLPETKLRLAAGVLGLATAILSALMLFLLRPYPYVHNFPGLVSSPVLALQLSRNADDLQRVLADGDSSQEALARKVLRTNNNLDLCLIPLYAGFLILFVRLFRRVPGKSLLRSLVLGSILGAAAFDYLEDYGIAQALRSPMFTGGLASAIAIPSHAKWGLFGVSLILVGVLLLGSDGFLYSRATLRIQGVLFLLGGLSILAGLVEHARIELGTELFAICVLWNAGALLGPALAGWLPGIRPQYIENFCDHPHGKDGRAVVP